MAAITTPLIVRFANEKIRVSADQWSQSYWTAKSLLAQAASQGISASIPNDSTIIDDGADVDGRPVMTGQVAHAILQVAAVVVHFVESAPVDPVTGVPTGAPPPLAAIMACAVNGAARF